MSLVDRWGATIKEASSERTVIVVVDAQSATLSFRYGMTGDSPSKFVKGIQDRLKGVETVISVLDNSIGWKPDGEPYVFISGDKLVMEVERKYPTKAWGDELKERVEIIRAICHRARWKVVIG